MDGCWECEWGAGVCRFGRNYSPLVHGVGSINSLKLTTCKQMESVGLGRCLSGFWGSALGAPGIPPPLARYMSLDVGAASSYILKREGLKI